MSVSLASKAAASAACLAVFLFALGSGARAQEFSTKLQISPQGGGHCIEVAGGEAAAGRGLQMADCSSGGEQSFIYDPAGMHLSFGKLCVDANGGKPGDLVKLSPCAAGSNQTWKSEQKGNFTKLVGQNNLCLDIRYGSKEIGAPVQSWNCGDSEPNQLWIFQRE
jgi:hypothetical protein